MGGAASVSDAGASHSHGARLVHAGHGSEFVPLCVKIQGAINLRDADWVSGTSDAYVVARVGAPGAPWDSDRGDGHNTFEWRSSTKDDTASPVWDLAFSFHAAPRSDGRAWELHARVYDGDNVLKADDFLGECRGALPAAADAGRNIGPRSLSLTDGEGATLTVGVWRPPPPGDNGGEAVEAPPAWVADHNLHLWAEVFNGTVRGAADGGARAAGDEVPRFANAAARDAFAERFDFARAAWCAELSCIVYLESNATWRSAKTFRLGTHTPLSMTELPLHLRFKLGNLSNGRRELRVMGRGLPFNYVWPQPGVGQLTPISQVYNKHPDPEGLSNNPDTRALFDRYGGGVGLKKGPPGFSLVDGLLRHKSGTEALLLQDDLSLGTTSLGAAAVPDGMHTVGDRVPTLVIVMRGTEPGSWADIKTDLKALLVDDPTEKPSAGGNGNAYGAKVHMGFKDAYMPWCEVLRDVVGNVVRQLNGAFDEGNVTEKRVRLVLCGHSLGGALATFAAKDLMINAPSVRACCASVSVYTIGSPRVGNAAFAARYDALVPDTWRCVNDRPLFCALCVGYSSLSFAIANVFKFFLSQAT